jgi:plasmid stabilization system protein ParE
VKVRLTRRAQDDLLEISASLAPYGLDYEERVLRTIDRGCQSLARFADRGSKLTLPDGVVVRRLVVGSYIVPYRIANRTVFILAVVHGARDLAEALAGLRIEDEQQ